MNNMEKKDELKMYEEALVIWKKGKSLNIGDRAILNIDMGLCCHFHFISNEIFDKLLISKLIDKEIKRVGRIAMIAPFEELNPRIKLLKQAIKILKNELK